MDVFSATLKLLLYLKNMTLTTLEDYVTMNSVEWFFLLFLYYFKISTIGSGLSMNPVFTLKR